MNKIFVTFQKEGFHQWKGAPEEVAFLLSSHRHIFKFRIEIEVHHYDRELEFFMVKRKLEEIPFSTNQGNSSCEMIARRYMNALINFYGTDRYYLVEVSEDGENGAIVT